MLKPKQKRSRERRRNILLAATTVLGEKGVHAATLTEISQAAGLSLPSLYDYFANKTELLAEIPQANFDEFYAEINPVLAASDDPLEQLRLFYLRTLAYIERNPAWARVFFVDIWPGALATEARVREAVDDYARRIIRIISDGIERGKLSDRNDPYLLTSILLGTMTHMVAVWLLYDRPYDLAARGEQALDLLLPIVRARGD